MQFNIGEFARQIFCYSEIQQPIMFSVEIPDAHKTQMYVHVSITSQLTDMFLSVGELNLMENWIMSPVVPGAKETLGPPLPRAG